jgi:hypothetical protein
MGETNAGDGSKSLIIRLLFSFLSLFLFLFLFLSLSLGRSLAPSLSPLPPTLPPSLSLSHSLPPLPSLSLCTNLGINAITSRHVTASLAGIEGACVVEQDACIM